MSITTFFTGTQDKKVRLSPGYPNHKPSFPNRHPTIYLVVLSLILLLVFFIVAWAIVPFSYNNASLDPALLV